MRQLRIRVQEADRHSVGGDDGHGLDTDTAGQRGQCAARECQAPQMPAVDVAGVAGVNDGAAIGCRRGIFDFEISRRQKLRPAAAGRYRIQVQPTIVLGGKYQPVSLRPEQLRV